MALPARVLHSISHRAAVSEEVLALMGRKRISQERLAQQLHMSQSTLSRRINADVAWDVDDLVGIAEFFGVTVEELVRACRSSWFVSSALLTGVPTNFGQGILFDPDDPELPERSLALVGA